MKKVNKKIIRNTLIGQFERGFGFHFRNDKLELKLAKKSIGNSFDVGYDTAISEVSKEAIRIKDEFKDCLEQFKTILK